MAASDQACSRFTQKLNSVQTTTNFLTGTLATALAGAGALASPASSARLFAGLAGIMSGVRAEFNADVFYQQIVPALRLAISDLRGEMRAEMYGHFKDDYAVYPVSVAFSDVIRYNDACSLVAAEAKISKTLALAENPGIDALNRTLLKVNLTREISRKQLVDSSILNVDGTGNALLLGSPEAAVRVAGAGQTPVGALGDAIAATASAFGRAINDINETLADATVQTVDTKNAVTAANTALVAYRDLRLTFYTAICQSSAATLSSALADARGKAVGAAGISGTAAANKALVIAQANADASSRTITAIRNADLAKLANELQSLATNRDNYRRQDVKDQSVFMPTLTQIKADFPGTALPNTCF